MEGLFSIAAFAYPWSKFSSPWARKIFTASVFPNQSRRIRLPRERRIRSLPRSALVSLPEDLALPRSLDDRPLALYVYVP